MKIKASQIGQIEKEIEAELGDINSKNQNQKSKSESDDDDTIEIDVEKIVTEFELYLFDILRENKGVSVPERTIKQHAKMGANILKKRLTPGVLGAFPEGAYLIFSAGIFLEVTRQLKKQQKKEAKESENDE